MPIHDQSYRRYRGTRSPGGRAWTVIAAAGLRTFLAKRAFVGLLILSWLPFVVRAVQMYAATNLPQATILAPTPQTFRQFLALQNVFAFFLTVYVGAGLIANDRRANALQIYLSKPLGRAEYVFGKVAVLMTFQLTITWLPAIVLLLVQMAFAGSFAFLRHNLFLLPAITVATFLDAIVGSASMLALSSLSRNGRYVGILYTGLIFFSRAIVGVLNAATGSQWWSWMSVVADLDDLGNRIFQLPVRDGGPWPMEILAVTVLVAGSGLILERRVRGVEVVA
jgi:ABC-2 type transport system permease protein